LSFVVLVLSMGLSVAHGQAGLVGHWRFDEVSGTVAADSAGGDNDGTLIGDQLEWRPSDGRSGGALWYGGVLDAYVEISTTGMSTSSGTVAMWGYLADPQPSQTRYFFGHTTDPAYNNRVQLFMDNGDTNLDLGLGDNHNRLNDITTFELEVWYHVAVTWDVGTYFVYINGEEAATGAYAGLSALHPVANIGNDGNASGPTEGFGGYLEEARIYDRALSAAEIQAIMQGEALPRASGPSPKDGSLHLATWASLEWRAGDFAVSHDVYIGDNFDDVNDAGPGAPGFQGNQTETSILVGFPGFALPGGLTPGMTYYWRVDEVNDADPNSPWKGNVWSFSLPPKTAYFPDPVDGAEFVDPNAALSWTAGDGAKLHTFYIGDNFDDVANATGGTLSGIASVNPGPLESEKVYYWRVDEFDGVETYKGDVWAFTTPGAVGNSQPANGAVDVQMNTILSWTAADTAASHELYFGTDSEAVNIATTASPEYAGPRALGAESYDPGGLAWQSSYAWRVDEVYPTGTVKGLVWTFTTADFIGVDDFESYNDVDPPDPNSNRIFDKWLDGFGTTTNGALVGNDMPPYAETTVVHGGAQSMIYSYDNNLKTSEATLTLVYPRDWTEGGVTRLSLWFKGASANVADRMFVALNGTAVVYHDDLAATQITGWNRWVIDLQAFADQGMNLANVSTITIGFGTKNSPAAGGAGQMYFDDIRLYR
jgi:hypothetical protein